MFNILQVMMSPADSTAFVGNLISKEIKRFKFTNCYLHGDAQDKAVYFRFKKRTTSGFFRYLSVLSIYFKFVKSKPDLIIAHRFKCVDISIFLANMYKCPLVIVVHGVGEYERPYRKRRLIRALKAGATIVCVSKYVEMYIKEKIYENTFQFNNQIVTIENSISFDDISEKQLSKSEALEEIGFLGEKKMLIGYVGRLANVKGVVDFVRAACMSEGKNYHFIVVGDGPLRVKLEDMVKNHGGIVSISFLGFTPSAFRIFRAFDFMIFPSRSEGFPLALLEAVASKTPFISTDIDIYKEIIGEDGVFYKPEDISELCHKISFFESLYDKDALVEYGEAQAIEINKKYPYENFISGYEQLLLEKLS